MNCTNKILTLLNDIKFQDKKVWVENLNIVTELQTAFTNKSLICDEFLIAALADLLLAVFPYTSDTSLNNRCQNIITLIFEILPQSLHDNSELRDALRIKLLEILDILIVYNVLEVNLLKIFTKQEIDEKKEKTNVILKKVGEQLPVLVKDIYSADYEIMLAATVGLRKLLAIERNPPIKEVIKAGVIPRLIKMLEAQEYPALQFEAAWALTNIASGTSEQTRAVVEHGAIAAFIPLLSSTNNDVRDQAVWALGNIAGDGTQCRDLVLNHGVIPTFVTILQSQASSSVSVMRNTTWALQNLLKNKPFPKFSVALQALPTLGRLIYSTDDEVVIDSCWGLSYISDYPDFDIEPLLHLNFIPRIIELMVHHSNSIRTPSLRFIGNIASCDDHIADKILSPKLLANLFELLHSSKIGLVKEAAWTVGNFAAGPPRQIQMIIDANIFPKIIDILATKSDEASKKEAAWAITNGISGSLTQQAEYLVKIGSLVPMFEYLKDVANAQPVLVKEFFKGVMILLTRQPDNKKYQDLITSYKASNVVSLYKDSKDLELSQISYQLLSILGTENKDIENLLGSMNIRAE